jgi:glycosyltransferase involved in cell wall biosynthesis
VRIACVSTILGYPWGSPDRLWTDLATRCQARGDAVFLGLSTLTADHGGLRKLCAGGAELFVRTANSIYRGTRDELTRRLPWRRNRYLETRLAAFRPDVVVLTQGATYDSLAEHHLVTWLHRNDVPYVVICHNNADGSGPGREEIRRLRTFFDRAAHTLFVSSHNLRVAERHLGDSLPRTGLIQNPLSAAGAAVPAGVPGPVPILGLVGRIDIAHKGIDLLLEAVASLPPRSVRLVLTGRVENPAAVSELVALHRLQDAVEIRGPLPAADVKRAFGELELFLLTSRYEGCASSMIEALMCGRPVLATDVGGVSDWVTDGVEGYVAPAITVDAIRATLVRALAERPRWPAMGAAARARFDRQRDPDPAGSLLALVDATLQTAARP